MRSLLIGSFFAGIGGGLLIEFVGAFNTSAWLSPETFVIFAAIIIGGLGNNAGAIAGSLAVPVIFVELPEFLPQIGSNPALIPETDNMVVGALLIATLWFRPQDSYRSARRTSPGCCGFRRVPAPREGAPPVADNALACSGLVKAFGGVQAVRGATFSVPEGHVCALIGPNGAGKSTAVNLIAGTMTADEGRVRLGGTDITGWPANRIARAGLIRTYQLSREFGRLTVLENLMVAPAGQPGESLLSVFLRPALVRAAERENLERALRTLRAFGLYDLRDSYAGDLSGGQKRLLELARSVMALPRAAGPRVLLLDEPTAGLSPAYTSVVWEQIARITQAGTAALAVEQNVDRALASAGHVYVLVAGANHVSGASAEIAALDLAAIFLGHDEASSARPEPEKGLNI